METTTDPTAPEKTFDVEPEALKAWQFYSDNYAQLHLAGLETENREFVLGMKPHKCRFCDGEPPTRTFTKTAHVVSKLFGNKVIKSHYECDECNKRFSAFEDDLGKMTLPFRTVGMVPGTNGVPTLLSATGEAEGKSRMEFRDGTLDVSDLAGAIQFWSMKWPRRSPFHTRYNRIVHLAHTKHYASRRLLCFRQTNWLISMILKGGFCGMM